MLNLLVYQQVQLVIRDESERIAKLWVAEKAIAQSQKNRQANQAAHYRLVAYQLWRMAMGYGMVILWLFLGLILGAIAGHNLLSRAVLCDQVVCELLRFDANKVLR